MEIYTCTCMKTFSKEYNHMHDFTKLRWQKYKQHVDEIEHVQNVYTQVNNMQ